MSQQIQDAKCIARTKTARKRAGFSPLRSLSCSLLFGSLVTSQVIAADYNGRVVAILDGDTLEILHDQHPERVRLSGIDCPEKGQAFGNRAKQATSALVFGRDVILQTHGQDKYGRTLADVFLLDGTNVNHELIKDGWCWWYRKYAPGDTLLEELEKEAQKEKKGLWIDPQPVPPWEWRRSSQENTGFVKGPMPNRGNPRVSRIVLENVS